MRLATVLSFALLMLVSPAWLAAEETRLGQHVDFELRDYRGTLHALEDYADHKLVVLAFLGTECPLAKLYATRLADAAAAYEDQGVAFIGISSNQQDSVTELAAYARRHGIEFPILKDMGNELADRISAVRTPEVFVLDEDRKVRYWGRIDDQYGFQDDYIAYQLPAPRRPDMTIALDELLAGKEVSEPIKEAPGCHIGRVKTPSQDADITYSSHIAAIMNDNCVFCHRPGQIAPFPLTSYDETVGWAEMIAEVVSDERMPPWHADPRYGKFVNDCRLSDEDKETIYRWVEYGAPEGDPDAVPAPPEYAEGWMIPEPDEIIYMRDEPYTVPAEGTVEYQNFVVDPGWDEDKWISAIEPKPGNPAVVHHIVMFVQHPGGPRKGAAGQLRADWLAAFAPGLRQPILEEGLARYVPAGSKLVFQMHYTPNGTEQTDLSYLGVKFADPETVKKEVAVKNAGNFTFTIPAGDPNYEVESEFVFRQDSLLISVSPHMHVRGKDFLYTLLYPDGKEETVLWVPRYDFGWQATYTFEEPKVLPKGTRMHCVAHFDNSDDNLNNPDPTIDVRWGEQTWEEMMFGWFEMALVDQDLTQQAHGPIDRVQDFLDRVEVAGLEVDGQTKEVASRALEKEEEFQFIAYYLADAVPQLDRVGITYVDERGKLRPMFVEEMNGLKSTLRSPSTVLKADGVELAKYISATEPVVNEDLSTSTDSLFKRMNRKGIVSSVHIPVVIDGVPATVNFWSGDAKAFPKQAVEYLSEVAQLIAKRGT